MFTIIAISGKPFMKLNSLSNVVFILFLAAASFAVYANSLSGEFLIDDQPAILHNESIHGLGDFFLKHFRFQSSALWDAAHAVIWKFCASAPFCYHLFNLLMHAGCAILLFLLSLELFKDKVLSFLCALIFALHPIHTEAVSWISGGPYALSGFFYLAAVLFYLKSSRSVYFFGLSMASFFFCYLSSNPAVTLPFMFLGCELFFMQKEKAGIRRRNFRVLVLALIFVFAFLQAVILLLNRRNVMHLIYEYNGLDKLAVNLKSLLYYLKILYMPLERGLYHPFAFSGADVRRLDPVFFLAVFLLVAAVFVFLKFRRSFRPVSFAVMWFFITYAPYSNFIPICNIISERYLYLPSAGFSIIIAALFLKAMAMINLNSRKVLLRYAAISALTLYLGAYAVLTVRRNYEYNNIFYYWQSNINNFKKGYVVYNNLAALFYSQGRIEPAMSYCWVNLMVNPDQPHVWCNLGMLYFRLNDYKMSRECYEEALKVRKDYPPALEALREIKKRANPLIE